MVNSPKVKGILKYLTKLSHPIDSFIIKFKNIKHSDGGPGFTSVILLYYDLEIITKNDDVPYCWDYFVCASNKILNEVCDIMDFDINNLYGHITKITVNGIQLNEGGSNITKTFIENLNHTLHNSIEKDFIQCAFWCNSNSVTLKLYFKYEISDVYYSDGFNTKINIYCDKLTVEDIPLENLTEEIVYLIGSYVSELEDFDFIFEDAIWSEFDKYMSLDDCSIGGGYIFPYIDSIGGIPTKWYGTVNHSTFSSKLCDFLNGDD